MKILNKLFVFTAGIILLSTQSFAADYHVLINDQQQGPVSMEQLQQMKNSGSITKDTLIWKNGMAGWEKAEAQEDLQGLFASATPPPIPGAVAPPAPPSVPAPLASSTVDKAANPDAIDPEEINSEVKPIIEAGEQVDKAFTQYANNKKIEFGAKKNGKIYYSAKQQVNADIDSAKYGKARVFAFERALLKIQKEFVVDMYGENTVKKANSVLEHERSDDELFPDKNEINNKVGEVWAKLVGLTGAKLDKALSDLGVDPDEYKAVPPARREVTFRDNFSKSMITTAMGDLTGLVPIQTFEAKEANGKTVIGVIGMYSKKLKSFSYSVAHKRPPMLMKMGGRALSEIIPSDPADLANEFGIRPAFNENGQLCLISYGQWSHDYKGKNDRKLERRRESASDSALDYANSYITEFIGGRLMMERDAEKKEIVEEARKKDSEGFIADDDVEDIVEKTMQEIKTKAKADLAGTTTFRKWKYKTKEGHELIGVVRTWTLDALKTAKDVRNWKHQQKSQPQKQTKKSMKVEVGTKAGKDIVDVDDF